MSNNRYKNTDWNLGEISPKGWTDIQGTVAVLMDIRDELQTLNAVFRCGSFLRIPRILGEIESNTRRRKRKTQ